MLTPAFQKQSGGIKGYEGFWGKSAPPRSCRLRRPRRRSRSATPTATSQPPGGPHEDTVTLRLTFEDGTYLIDGEA